MNRALLIACLVLTALLGVQSWRIDRLKAAPVKTELKTVERVVYRTAKADAATQKIGERSQAAQTQIRYVTRTIVEKVPIYVTPETDARFALPVGFVRLHDAAALGLDPAAVPDASGKPDDAASAVAPSTAATVIADNYGQCREDEARFAALQDWVRAQQALWNAGPP